MSPTRRGGVIVVVFVMVVGIFIDVEVVVVVVTVVIGLIAVIVADSNPVVLFHGDATSPSWLSS